MNHIKNFYEDCFKSKTGWQGLSAEDAIESFIRELTEYGQKYLTNQVIDQHDGNVCILDREACKSYLIDNDYDGSEDQVEEFWSYMDGVADYMCQAAWNWMEQALGECSFYVS